MLGIVGWGAWIQMKPGRRALDANAVRAFATGKRAHYKIPRYVDLFDEFPMTVTGKIRKVDMRKDKHRDLRPLTGIGDYAAPTTWASPASRRPHSELQCLG